MGNLFFETFEEANNKVVCSICKTFISKQCFITSFYNIETAYGECLQFSNLINCVYLKNFNHCIYNFHDSFDLFDDDSIIPENDNDSHYIHCKQCNLFLGWKYCYKHIILRSSILIYP